VPEPELLIGPIGLEGKIVAQIDSAQSTLEVASYQLSRANVVSAIIDAHQRGVKTRVMVDGDQYVNGKSKQQMLAAGVEVKNAPAEFEHGHAKLVIVDGVRATILSGNLNDYTMVTERNYGVIDTAWDDVADVRAIFERDWSGAALDLACTRLIVSPENARERIGGLIEGAKQKLDLSVMYISDKDTKAAVKARAAAGVPTRVLLAHPGWIEENAQTAQELQAAGIPAKYMGNLDLHAKLVIADGVAYVGSTNMSWTSIEKNREVGVFVTEPGPAAKIQAQFEQDWGGGLKP
jgi:phosphatidylserine/phosphatidylglycerophosphate/cardiolipin synthase-like enzyme